MLKGYLFFSKDNITVGYVEKDSKFTEGTHTYLKKAFSFLSEYFHIKETLPMIRAVIVPDRCEFDRLVEQLLKIDIEKPSNPRRIAQVQRTEMVFLSPSAYSKDSIYEYSEEEYRRLIFHESTHVVSEYLSPDIERMSGWWGEGLAVYLSNQWKYEDEFRKPVLEGVSRNTIPCINHIENKVKLSYIWGWTIVKYIEEYYSKDMIVKIVKECKDGNVFSILGQSIKDFERKWKNYLREGTKTKHYKSIKL
ncbi:hypothetical protein KAX29_02785 [candidate division WOR-3 bacterium]|nr:hypothetical protein [candidate division WOR-3 bacterium]